MNQSRAPSAVPSGIPVKQFPRFIAEIQKDASIQHEINMIGEALQNNIGHIKDILNKNNNKVESHKSK